MKSQKIEEPKFNFPTKHLGNLQNYISLIDSNMERIIVNQPLELRLAIKQTLKTSGKHIRSLLALLSCGAVCGEPKYAVHIASAYELAHTAALIQDDIIDNSPKRRYNPSVWTIWGSNKAMLISDILIFEIFDMIAKYQKQNLSQDRLYNLLRIVNKTAKLTIQGELLDLELAEKEKASLEEYLIMIKYKTGALFAGAAASGATVGGGTTEEVMTLFEFAEKLGMAYQIYDDIQDIIGREEYLGKPIFNDFKNGKKNAVIIHALNNSNEKDNFFLKSLLGKKEIMNEEIEKARNIIRSVGSVEQTFDISNRLAEEGRELLSTLKPSVSKEHLMELSFIASKIHI